MTYRISVDTGGTFTDVIVRGDDGGLTIGKALTAHDRTFVGIKEAIESAAVQLDLGFDELIADTTMFIYGTTRATNAIVTKRVAKTAFVTTEGFPDTLLLREGGKFDPHDFTQDYPDPYIARRDTFEIAERVLVDGSVAQAFDEAEARRTIEQIGRRGYEAVAVCFLWSVVNPEHEARFGELLDEILPGVPYTLSHKLIPVVREYRRASATAIDASLKPLMQKHLLGLQADLREAGFTGRILISTSEGGCNEVDALVDKPIYTVGSGPAMAPIAARTFANLEGLGDDVIICDTGGTTFDVGLVRGGRLVYTRDTWLGPKYLVDLLGISAVDMRSIGAGGGSIAWIDEGGLLHVGPQSAGSEPGPACYGRGGEFATVSDAAVVLGYFNPDNFLGGRMQLDVDAARKVVGVIADQIGLTVEETAFRIMSLASDLMMHAVSDITIKEGFNPRESTLVAGGGAAGINIMTIASGLGARHPVAGAALRFRGRPCRPGRGIPPGASPRVRRPRRGQHHRDHQLEGATDRRTRRGAEAVGHDRAAQGRAGECGAGLLPRCRDTGADPDLPGRGHHGRPDDRGPAIIEEPTTTVVVYPGMSAEVSAEGNYLLRLS